MRAEPALFIRLIRRSRIFRRKDDYMITSLNRRELICTFDFNVQARIRNILNENNIPYKIKIIDRNSSSPSSSRNRSNLGTLGEKVHIEKEYIVYVQKNDFDHAQRLIQQKA